MLEDGFEQISIFSMGAGAVVLLGIWIFFKVFRMPADFAEKEKNRLRLKVKLMESESAARELGQEENLGEGVQDI